MGIFRRILLYGSTANSPRHYDRSGKTQLIDWRVSKTAPRLPRLVGAIVSTVSLCNNSNAKVATCAPGLGGFATGQSYTSPATTFGTFTTPTAGGILYAIPFVSPLGEPISKMSIFVTAAGTATKCRLGVYGVDSGAPGALLLDAGDVTLSGTGVQQKLGLNFLLSPNALYFLALGCDMNVTLEAGGATGNLSGMLGGLAAMGLHLLDNLDLERVAQACADEGRHAFLLTLAPLRISGGTGSPLNPVAVF